MTRNFCLALVLVLSCATALSSPVIYINQVAFNTNVPKIAIVGSEQELKGKIAFEIKNEVTGQRLFTGLLGSATTIREWMPNFLYAADFSSVTAPGTYRLFVTINGKVYSSDVFTIGENALQKLVLPAIVNYYHKQRATTPGELHSDSSLLLYGSDTRVDLHGGWCDASGDVSKYFSHLAYANFMSPQQTPLVTWVMLNAVEKLPESVLNGALKTAFEAEALYGADYLARSLSDSGYFYMIVFSYFNKDPQARRVVGLLANSVTTNEYQAAFREGAGMAIAALARASQWKQHGEYTQQQYLAAAEKAFAHLLINNTRYDDDGKENIIDDYCALMAATELWVATGKPLYKTEARKRASNLNHRLTPRGYFRANDEDRPYWHASDAGMPIIALWRYLQNETDATQRAAAMNTIKQSLSSEINLTRKGSNPFGYPRQTFKLNGSIHEGFFIPHENETGWWWQGENARLASLSAAALVGANSVFKNDQKMRSSLLQFSQQQLNWILGGNPYEVCFLYGFGRNNVPYMQSNFGHGSEVGGISNGITGKEGKPDGSGIEFKTEAAGNEWRWTEQWIPHAAWFLFALTVQADDGK